MFTSLMTLHSNMGDYLLYSSVLALETASICIIGRYDPSHSSSEIDWPAWLSLSREIRWEDCAQSRVLLPLISPSFFAEIVKQHSLIALAARYVNDPSPATFIGALSTFTLAALYLHHCHRVDQYQNAFLAGSACGTILLSCAIQFMFPQTRWLKSLQTYLPLAIILASCFSAVIHRLGILDSTSRGHKATGQGSAIVRQWMNWTRRAFPRRICDDDMTGGRAWRTIGRKTLAYPSNTVFQSQRGLDSLAK